MLPFFVWGGWITLFRDAIYLDFFYNYWKFGYWYLLVLFEFNVVYLICEKISSMTSINRKPWIIILTYIIAYTISRVIPYIMPISINLISCYSLFYDYFAYFIIGILVTKFNLSLFFKQNSSLLFTLFAVISIPFYILWDNNSIFQVSATILRISIILGIFIMFMIFDQNKAGNKLENHVNGMLSSIGRYTLSIYMIQFFLFRYINLQEVGKELYSSGNYLIIILMSIALAIIICYICIAIEKIITISSLFSTILLGKRYSRKNINLPQLLH